MVSAVFALDSTEAPTLETFNNLFSAVTDNYGRFLFALAADSPAVQVVFKNAAMKQSFHVLGESWLPNER